MTDFLRRELDSKFRLRANEDGSFRLLCVSDFHARLERPRWDPRLRRTLEAMLDKSDPNLLFVAGDLTHDDAGLGSDERLREYISDVLSPAEERGLAWAHIPGNHDREEGLPTRIFSEFPRCLSKRGDPGLDGYGTYLLPVWRHDGSTEGGPLYCVWAFDSHTGLDGCGEYKSGDRRYSLELPNFITGFSHYDGVHFNQCAWYWELSRALEEEYGRKIPGVMIMHAPPPEMRLIPTNPSQTGMTGVIREEVGCASINTGIFAAAYERGDIRAIISGHDHINNFAGTYMGILLTEDAGLGYDVYGDDDLRGGRVIDFDGGSISSFHLYAADCISSDDLQKTLDEANGGKI